MKDTERKGIVALREVYPDTQIMGVNERERKFVPMYPITQGQWGGHYEGGERLIGIQVQHEGFHIGAIVKESEADMPDLLLKMIQGSIQLRENKTNDSGSKDTD